MMNPDNGPCKDNGPGPRPPTHRTTWERTLLLAVPSLLILLLVCLLWSLPVDAGGSGDYPPPATGDWVIGTGTQVFNETWVISGDVLIQTSGSLDLDNVTLLMNSSYEGQFHIEVEANGTLDAKGSTFTALNTSNRFYFVVRADGHVTIDDCVLEWMGMEDAVLYEQMGLTVFSNDTVIGQSTIRDSRAGLYIEGASPTVVDNLFTGNFYAVWVFDSELVVLTGNTMRENNVGIVTDRSTILVMDCDLVDNNHKGITALSSSVLLSETNITGTKEIGLSGLESDILMINGTLEGETYDLVLNKNSSMLSLNGTIDRFGLTFKDWLSHLSVHWALEVEVVWWSDMGPVANATIEVFDAAHIPVANGTTGVEGVLRDLLVPGYDANKSKVVFHSPIEVVANASGLMGNATAELVGPSNVMVMIDDIAPGINITAPARDGYHNQNEVRFEGVMWDNESGPWFVEIAVDRGNYTAANGTVVWNLTIDLSEGVHVVFVRAWDLAGNSRTLMLNITIDTVPPAIALVSPEDGLVTNLTVIWVNGSVEVGANITIGDMALNNTNGSFGLFFELEEGPNTITVVATDLAGNVATATVNVTRDTMVDPLTLVPVNGTSTNDTNLTVRGNTEPGTLIIIRWTSINGTGNNTTVVDHNITVVAGPDGNFTLRLTLAEGINNFTLYAKDLLNNTALLNLTYHLDSTRPLLVMTSPSSKEHFTNRNGVNIKGHTEEGARVYIGQQELQLYDLQFSIRVEVFLGINNFTLWAVDQAGNVASMNITVYVDKEAPFLNISRPFDPVVKTTGAYYTLSGFTEANATVTVNGVRYPVRSDGYFTAKRSLAFGKNKITITAKDQAGNPVSKDRIIIRERPPPDMTMYYIGISVPIVVVVVLVLVSLLYLHKKGKLKKVKRWFRRGKDDDEPEEMEEDLPPSLPDPGGDGLSDEELPPPDLPDLKDEGVELEKAEGMEDGDEDDDEVLEDEDEKGKGD